MPSRPWLAPIGLAALVATLSTVAVALVTGDARPDGWCDVSAGEASGAGAWADVVVRDGRIYEAVGGDVEPADVDTSRIVDEVACRGDGSDQDHRVQATSLEPGTRLFAVHDEPVERRLAAETDHGYVVYAVEEAEQLEVVEGPAPSADAVVVTAEELGRSVALERGPTAVGTVALDILGRDGSATTIEVAQQPGELRWFVDRDGAIVWQWVRADDLAPIFRSWPDSSAVVWRPLPGETGALVGLDADGARALVEVRRGVTPEEMTAYLVIVPLEVPDGEVLLADVAGWESSIVSAASLELSLYAVESGGDEAVYVAAPDSDDAIPVVEGGEASGQRVAGVGVTDGAMGVVLIVEPAGFPDLPRARLGLVELETGRVTVVHQVPVGLGLDGGWASPQELSVGGDHLLVNRYADGEWLPALVFDRSTGDWMVLGSAGRARLGPAELPEPEPEPSGCGADDALLANAPPTPGALHLYLPCTEVVGVVHRTGAPEPRSGDPVADARWLLDRILGPLDAELEARAYHNYGHTGIAVRELTLDADGTLAVDLDVPDGGVNNLSTSYAGYIYRLTLTANLLQIEGVEGVELWAGGSCEAHSAMFEGYGCPRFTAADAPWNASRR